MGKRSGEGQGGQIAAGSLLEEEKLEEEEEEEEKDGPGMGVGVGEMGM